MRAWPAACYHEIRSKELIRSKRLLRRWDERFDRIEAMKAKAKAKKVAAAEKAAAERTALPLSSEEKASPILHTVRTYVCACVIAEEGGGETREGGGARLPRAASLV